MGKLAEPPKLEDIDSPEHRKLYDVALVIGVKNTVNYDELVPFLNRYGDVTRVVKEEPGGAPFIYSEPYIMMFAMNEGAERLRRDYARNGKTALRYVKSIEDYHHSRELDY
jgi:hypothetical protein